MKFVYPCVVRGYHVYRVYWDPVTDEELATQPDPDGRKFGDKHRVAVMKDGITVGNLPKDISCLAFASTLLYTGEQLNTKSPERKNIQRCCVVVWRCPVHTNLIWRKMLLQRSCDASKTSWSASTKHGRASSRLPEKKKKNVLFRTNKCLERITKFCSVIVIIFIWQPFQTSRRLIDRKKWQLIVLSRSFFFFFFLFLEMFGNFRSAIQIVRTLNIFMIDQFLIIRTPRSVIIF